MKVSVIFEDKSIVINGSGTHFNNEYYTYFDTVMSNAGHGTAHAIQWDSETEQGELEVTGQSNINITADIIQPYIDLVTEQKQRVKEDLLAAADAEAMARGTRDFLLSETDWWATSDRTMTQEQIDYRRALRDLPTDSENWNPVVVWNDEFECATYTGVTFPTKPE